MLRYLAQDIFRMTSSESGGHIRSRLLVSILIRPEERMLVSQNSAIRVLQYVKELRCRLV